MCPRVVLLVAISLLHCALSDTAGSVDVDQALLSRIRPAVNESHLSQLDQLEAQIQNEIRESSSLANQYSKLKDLVKVKDAQLEDAKSVAQTMQQEHQKSIEAVMGLRAVLDRSHNGSSVLAEELKYQLGEENKLKEQLLAEESKMKGLQQTLKDTRAKALDPSLSKWVERRIEDVGSALDSPDSGRMLGAAVGSAVDTARDTVGSIEESAARRGAPVLIAGLFSFLVVFVPAAAVTGAVRRLTSSISYRQHLLVGHIANIFFLLTCTALTMFTRYDPLIVMHHSSPHHALVLMLFFCLQWPVMLSMMLYSAFSTKTANEREVFLAQAFLYLAVFFHVLKHTYPRILFGQPAFSFLSSNLKNYILYLMSAFSMLVLTISSADTDSEGLVGDMRSMLGEGRARSEDGEGSGRHLNGREAKLQPSSEAPPSPVKARFSRGTGFGGLGSFYKAE